MRNVSQNFSKDYKIKILTRIREENGVFVALLTNLSNKLKISKLTNCTFGFIPHGLLIAKLSF